MLLEWVPLGSVQVGLDWTALPALTSSRIFRAKLVCANFDLLILRGSVLIRQEFDIEDFVDYLPRERLYLHPKRQTLNIEIHPDLKSRGITERRIAVKRSARYYRPFYTEPILTCEIEALV